MICGKDDEKDVYHDRAYPPKSLYDQVEDAMEGIFWRGVLQEGRFSAITPNTIIGLPPFQGLPPFTEAKSLGPNSVLKKLGYSEEEHLR